MEARVQEKNMSVRNEGQTEAHNTRGGVGLIILITVLGIAMAIWGILDIIKTNDFTERAIETVGTIVDYQRSKDEDNEDIYYAIYEYYVDGIMYTVKDDDFAYSKPEFGETGVVYYDSDNPKEARMTLDGHIGAVLVVVGIFFGLAGTLFILAKSGVSESVIHRITGLLLIVIGFVLPIAAHTWLMLMGTGIFGVIGVAILRNACERPVGREGDAMNPGIDRNKKPYKMSPEDE